jgi:Rrf2 family transcriptional regulator, iron-sulfur cluster assembly transcription factor
VIVSLSPTPPATTMRGLERHMARKYSPNRVSFPIVSVLPANALLAVAVVLDLALQKTVRPVPSKFIAARHGVSARYLETMLRSLVRKGILGGSRGPHGGYRFARDRNATTLNDILRAVGDDDEEPQSEIITKVVLPLLAPAERALKQALDQIDLDDLIRYTKAVRADRVGT